MEKRATADMQDQPRQPRERSLLGYSGVALAERQRLACPERVWEGDKIH